MVFILSIESPLTATSFLWNMSSSGDNSEMIMKECGLLSSSGAAGPRSCASSSRVQATTSLQMEDATGVHFTNGMACNKPLAPHMICCLLQAV